MPRKSISAEAYGLYNKKPVFVPKVIEKSDEAKEKIRAKLSQVFMFQLIDDKELKIVIDAMDIVTFQPEGKVIVEGEQGDALYIVESGQLDCSKIIKGVNTHLLVYTSGRSFGELSLLYDVPRAASITAIDECVLYKLDRDTFNNIVKGAAIKRRDMYDEFLKKVPLLENLGSYEWVMLTDSFIQQKFKWGDYIIKEGDIGEDFYFVVEGEA